MSETIIGDVVNHYVEIVARRSDVVVQRLGPMSERKAERVERGVAINMNHDGYFTRIVFEAPISVPRTKETT